MDCDSIKFDNRSLWFDCIRLKADIEKSSGCCLPPTLIFSLKTQFGDAGKTQAIKILNLFSQFITYIGSALLSIL